MMGDADRAGGGRPLPVPDALSAPYWAAAARHVLAIARCARCAAFVHPPSAVCPACGSSDPGFRFEPVSGRGRLRAWTIVRQALLPGFAALIPYCLADVELDEQAGLRLTGRLLDSGDAVPALGARVRVAFEDLAPGVAVPAFRLEGAA